MKRFYLRLRVMLMMLALGLASVGFFDWFSNYWYEVPVELPKVESNSPIFVFPSSSKDVPKGVDSAVCCRNVGGGGAGEFASYIDKKSRNKRTKITKNKIRK